MDILKSIGERIRNYRKEQNLTQIQLAELSNVNEGYVGKVERGERNITMDSLLKLTSALEISLEDLFRNIQPDIDKEQSSTMNEINNRLQGRNLKEQKKILALIDVVLNDKY